MKNYPFSIPVRINHMRPFSLLMTFVKKKKKGIFNTLHLKISFSHQMLTISKLILYDKPFSYNLDVQIPKVFRFDFHI